MSHIDTIGRAPRETRFATIKGALSSQTRYLRRARRRWSALLPRKQFQARTSDGALVAGVKALRVLQEFLDHADVIALDVREPGHAGAVHMLVTLPTWLLDDATALAAHDEDDEDTGDDEPNTDDEPGTDAEPSLGSPENMSQGQGLYSGPFDGWGDSECDLSSLDGMIDQRRCSEGKDDELDRADDEPSLGTLDGEIDQERWSGGHRLDRERGEGGVDCDDDENTAGGEEDEDLEPDDRRLPKTAEDDPRLGGVIPWADAATANAAAFGYSKPMVHDETGEPRSGEAP